MTRAVGYRWNPEPVEAPGEGWREKRREELAEDWEFVSEAITESPLLAYRDAWRHTHANGTVYVHPAITTGAATLRALLTGSEAEILAAVFELRAYVDDKIEEQAREDWQDFCDGLGEP